MTRNPPRSYTVETYIDYDDLRRPDADAPCVRVWFTASAWVPYSPATWDDPAEGGLFEDVRLLRVEIDPRSMPDTLTAAEVEEVEAWFDTEAAWELAQDQAEGVMRRGMAA